MISLKWLENVIYIYIDKRETDRIIIKLKFYLTMSRAVLQPFEAYQKARVQFVQTVAELATRP
jgi:hypothetical protein